MFCTDTTIVPEVSFKGAVIVLDMPIGEWGDLGRQMQGIFKYMWQRAVLRRDIKENPRPLCLFQDEAQAFINPFDYEYQARVRAFKGCTVSLTQNISNYYAALGAGGRDQADALLGNLVTKIFHANSDKNTNQYAIDTIGQAWQMMIGGSEGGVTWQESAQYQMLTSAFTTLRKGGPENRGEVDGIVFQGGRVWRATGSTFIPVVFKQPELKGKRR
jgi:hypothetical protein